MSNTSNPFTEIAAIVLAGLFIIAGGLLLYAGKVDFTQASIIFGLAVAVYTGKVLAQAPSSTQQTQLATLASRNLDVINKMVDQQTPPAPVAPTVAEPQPGQKFTTPVPQPPIQPSVYNTPVQQFVPQPPQMPYVVPQQYVPDRDWSAEVTAMPTQRIAAQ